MTTVPTKIYMNNAATSWPKPACVAQAVQNTLTAQPGSMHRGGLDTYDVFEEVRKELALLLGISDPDQIALGSNATWALNLALFGFPFQEGDIVVTTKAEHNSVLRPLHRLAAEKKIQVHYLDTDPTGRVPLDLWETTIQKFHPRLAVFSHASNVTGAVMDAQSMTRIAKANGAFVLIDASQTLGCFPLSIESWGADMAAFTGHKYLLGPQGTGGLYVSKDLSLKPYLTGGTGIHSDRDEMPEKMPLHLEAGTGNEPSFAGLLAALQWQKENPFDFDKETQKIDVLKSKLQRAGASVICPEGLCTPVVSFTIPGETVPDIGYILQESYDIICRTGIHCAPKIFSCLPYPETVRLSLSRFTTYEEIQEAILAVEDIIG